jgi:hypothetical protein
MKPASADLPSARSQDAPATGPRTPACPICTVWGGTGRKVDENSRRVR